MSLSITIALFSKQLVYAWTENMQAAIWCENVLFYYALGSGVLAVLGFQYYLQVAIGKLDLHIKGGTLSLFIDVPIIVIVAFHYGAEILGLVWFILRSLWFFLWTPVVHKKFANGLHLNWLFKDVLLICVPMFLAYLFFKNYVPTEMEDRLKVIVHFSISFLGFFILGIFSSSFIRNYLIINYLIPIEKRFRNK
jgi:hypothetical protein